MNAVPVGVTARQAFERVHGGSRGHVSYNSTKLAMERPHGFDSTGVAVRMDDVRGNPTVTANVGRGPPLGRQCVNGAARVAWVGGSMTTSTELGNKDMRVATERLNIYLFKGFPIYCYIFGCGFEFEYY